MVGVVAGCAGAPPHPPATALALAEAHLENGEPQPALELLESVEAEDFADEDLERYLLRHATALAQNNELWQAFDTIRDFGDEYAFSRYDADVQSLEFQVGAALIQSSGGFWIFTSDTDDGRIVLEHFMVHYPEHPAIPDALRLLGEKEYVEGNYILARERFRDLALEHNNSEWLELARFRIAMSSYHALSGPRYDLRSMERTLSELQGFLESPVENPRFREQAASARTTVREWLGRKHVLIAEFYKEVGNEQGRVGHLKEAATGYPDTAAGRDAKSRLEAETASAEEGT